MDDYKRRGTSKAGAPIYKGKWRKPPLLLAAFNILEAATLFFGIVIVTSRWQRSVAHLPQSFGIGGSYMLGVGVVVFGVTAVAYASSALWMLKTRYRLRHLQTTDQICTQFGMGDDVFHAWREQQTIKPHININGTDYYRPSDFVDAGTLLRASVSPVTPATLLRPVVHAEPAATEQLLRASE